MGLRSQDTRRKRRRISLSTHAAAAAAAVWPQKKKEEKSRPLLSSHCAMLAKEKWVAQTELTTPAPIMLGCLAWPHRRRCSSHHRGLATPPHPRKSSTTNVLKRRKKAPSGLQKMHKEVFWPCLRRGWRKRRKMRQAEDGNGFLPSTKFRACLLM